MTHLHSYKIPESAICAAAQEYAERTSDPFLFNHVIRSFIFADAVGQASGAAFDHDLLHIACVLHDLGLTSIAPVKTRFEIEGADAARAFLAERGIDEGAQEIVWDAIALHTTSVIPQRKRPEIALCQLGTAIDVGFAPLSLLPEGVAEDALARFPRLGFKDAMQSTLCGLLERNRLAAASSPAVADVGERMIPGFRRAHICDVIAGAAFEE